MIKFLKGGQRFNFLHVNFPRFLALHENFLRVLKDYVDFLGLVYCLTKSNLRAEESEIEQERRNYYRSSGHMDYTLFFIRNRFIRNLHVEGRNI